MWAMTSDAAAPAVPAAPEAKPLMRGWLHLGMFPRWWSRASC